MKKPFLSRINSWIVFVLSTLFAAATLVAFSFLINYLRKEEIKRINLLSKAIKIQQDVEAIDANTGELIKDIYESNNSIPVILMDKNHIPMEHRNIPENIVRDKKKILEYAKGMSKNYPPIELKFPDGNNQFVYYDNSNLLNNLRYSPFILGIFIISYLMFTYWFLRTIKKTDEGFLWAGLAKETAHQIGTPLSSMIGWIEIMRMENPNSESATEIEKDVERLRTISERFSKIGSIPELNDMNLTETIQQNYDYLKTRISGKVDFYLHFPSKEILVNHNRILMSWVIENLVKNAVDAMKGQGKLDISLYEKNRNIIIDFKDSGCGMTSRQAANAFKPGFSTKKRGWGLGLSLAKRVVNEYHKGDIKIAHTDVGKGSTFRVVMKKK